MQCTSPDGWEPVASEMEKCRTCGFKVHIFNNHTHDVQEAAKQRDEEERLYRRMTEREVLKAIGLGNCMTVEQARTFLENCDVPLTPFPTLQVSV